ncbi:MAG: DUF3795 domain-containing protein [bacterium]
MRTRKKVDSIACCGLNCSECRLRTAAGNRELQKGLAAWFRDNLKLEVEPGQVRCSGCHGPRDEHWNPDCWILACCASEHGRNHCSDCPELPCRQLRDWAAQSPRYAAALKWLRDRRTGQPF